jgi:hypothetical protein
MEWVRPGPFNPRNGPAALASRRNWDQTIAERRGIFVSVTPNLWTRTASLLNNLLKLTAKPAEMIGNAEFT